MSSQRDWWNKRAAKMGRWGIADQLEVRLNKMFPTLYCNVSPSERMGFYMVKASRRFSNGDIDNRYIFEQEESLWDFPDATLRARLWLIS